MFPQGTRNEKVFLKGYRISAPDGNKRLVPRRDPSLFFGPGKTFQNRNVSSPAPVTTVWPSGDIARYKTLYVCPVKVATFDMEGYFHTII